jgi:hypothetical protein
MSQDPEYKRTFLEGKVHKNVYAAVAENYADLKYYISDQRRACKVLFLSFDAAWTGVSQDKISALKNL